jgi:LysR family transcriptional regulator, regulator for bpeEF and oprC
MAVHKLRGLEYLVAVVDRGGFSAAARHLGVSAPSVHRLVQALEAELGIGLIDRSAHPLRPTPQAVSYVERVRALLTELKELDAGLKDRTQSPRGTVSVAAHGVALQFVVADALARFHARCPDIRVELFDAGSSRDLAQLGADALLQFGWPPEQDAVLRTLAHTRWLVVATPAFWVRHGVPARPADLAGCPCALFKTPFGEVMQRWAFVRGDEREEVVVDGWLVSDHRSALDAPVYEGLLAARINDLTAHPGLADGRLQPVLLDWQGLNAPPLSLLVRRSVSRQPRIRAWVDFMVDLAAQRSAVRLPAGLPPVRPSNRPDWWRKRVGADLSRRPVPGR